MRVRERDEYGLSIVPREASVNVDGKGCGEVNGGESESGGEGLESIIPNLTCYSHSHPIRLTRVYSLPALITSSSIFIPFSFFF